MKKRNLLKTIVGVGSTLIVLTWLLRLKKKTVEENSEEKFHRFLGI